MSASKMKKRRAASSDLVFFPKAPRLSISSVLSPLGQPFIDAVITPVTTCKICAETYSFNSNARVLPCGHTICESCILSIRSDAQTKNEFSLSCPYCRHSWTFQKVEDFPKNYSILDMIEFTNALTVSISCDENACIDRSTFQVASTRRHFKRSASSTAVSNASNYIGSVDANGKAHGYGSCIWPDGRWGLGQWQHGDLFGWAGLFFKDGSVLIGEWVNGICHGFGMFMSPDGVVQSGVWRQGQCVIYDH